MENNIKLRFAKIISGIFSNKEQALEYPNKYANINIYFRPLSWDFFNCHAFYSEQSYDYAPWDPYKQSINKLSYRNGILIIDNYKIENAMRYSGGGLDINLLKDINKEKIIEKKGCSMHFKEDSPGNFIGNIMPGRNCCILKGKKYIYTISQVRVNSQNWISEDSGYERKTNKKVWGSNYGPLRFKKIKSYNQFIDENW